MEHPFMTIVIDFLRGKRSIKKNCERIEFRKHHGADSRQIEVLQKHFWNQDKVHTYNKNTEGQSSMLGFCPGSAVKRARSTPSSWWVGSPPTHFPGLR